MTKRNDANLPPVPTTRDELLIAALRHAEMTGVTLNAIRRELYRVLGARCDDRKYDHLHVLLRRSLYEDSGLFLFIGADNIGIELPVDLLGQAAYEIDDSKFDQHSRNSGWPNGDDVVRAKMGGKARPQLPVASSPKPGARPFNAKVSRRVPVAQRETIT